ncbi:FAM71A isoform 1 [Pan troglodytes]|uniref:Family with sequence similarity 71, member A n=2 Tax=Pan troglodytes TaxID=9598 RepID=G2HEQ4_PANTR|nr:Golgi-associated RAB2 interactor protein 4 [Pan troglodytes]PNJ00221.1 FAM71A isoform 1 [Pan troglodytes]BAK62212.1 family with sequence similarity 71, member A [Pan troglodytes]
MNADFLLPYYTAQSGSSMSMFNTTMGKLQRQLYKGEYDIFKYAPIFESDFIQITKRGEVIDVHNRVRMVTMGIARTSPILPLPDVMLLARPATGCEEYAGHGQATKRKKRKAAKNLELTRLLPLKFVRISVQDHEKQQLRLKFATGRSCYLQLCPALNTRDDLFAYWEKLIYLLRPPMESNSSTCGIPAEDMMWMPVFQEDRRSLGALNLQGKGDQDHVSIQSLHMVSEVCGATSAAYAGGEGLQNDFHKPTNVLNVSIPKTSTELAEEPATGAIKEAAAAGAAAGTATGTIAGALSVAAANSAPGQVSTAIAGAATIGAGGNKSNMALAGTASMAPNSTKVAVAGAAGKSSEHVSSASMSLSREGSVSLAIAGVVLTSRTAAETDMDAAAGPPVSTRQSKSSLSGQHGRERTQASAEGCKEGRERREKDRALGRSSHRRRTGESRHKTRGDKIARKSSSRSSFSHRANRDDKNEKGCGNPGSSRHGDSHKGVSHTPISKESRTSHKSGRSLSTTISGSSKGLGRISSFLRNVRANLTTKAVGTPHGGDVDIMAKMAERSTNVAIAETAEGGQGLEMVGSMTPDIMETVTFEAH